MDRALTDAIETLLLPPGSLLLLGIAGLVSMRWFRKTAPWLIGASLLLLYLFSTPWVGNRLLHALETYPPLDIRQETVSTAQAIVILGGGRHADTPDYGGDTVNATSLERLRYGARLARASTLPILVSGGAGPADPVSEAALMGETLKQDFGLAPRWIEDRSRTTWDNARESAAILHRAGIRRIILVTHANHMPRAMLAFRHFDLQAIPASTLYTRPHPGPARLRDWLPDAKALRNSYLAGHEWLGWLWYRLRIAIG